nr:MAG TPA: hypothetical protein [Caudoviricetes sp.]
MQTSQSRERVKGQCPLGGEEPRAFLPFSIKRRNHDGK